MIHYLIADGALLAGWTLLSHAKIVLPRRSFLTLAPYSAHTSVAVRCPRRPLDQICRSVSSCSTSAPNDRSDHEPLEPASDVDVVERLRSVSTDHPRVHEGFSSIQELLPAGLDRWLNGSLTLRSWPCPTAAVQSTGMICDIPQARPVGSISSAAIWAQFSGNIRRMRKQKNNVFLNIGRGLSQGLDAMVDRNHPWNDATLDTSLVE